MLYNKVKNKFFTYEFVLTHKHRKLLERHSYSMKCKDAEKMIPAFLQDDLDSRELRQFIKHIDSCKECMEELSIQFLVVEGLERLESGTNFNLQNALSTKLSSARQEISINNTLKRTLICLEAAVAAAIIISLVILFQ